VRTPQPLPTGIFCADGREGGRAVLRPELSSWTNCFPSGTSMLSYSVSYSQAKGHDSDAVVMASDLVGLRGLEPRTSSLSGKRSNRAELQAPGVADATDAPGTPA
jgi:hypothetical protein